VSGKLYVFSQLRQTFLGGQAGGPVRLDIYMESKRSEGFGVFDPPLDAAEIRT
jgi:hypothetical protein